MMNMGNSWFSYTDFMDSEKLLEVVGLLTSCFHLNFTAKLCQSSVSSGHHPERHKMIPNTPGHCRIKDQMARWFIAG